LKPEPIAPRWTLRRTSRLLLLCASLCAAVPGRAGAVEEINYLQMEPASWATFRFFQMAEGSTPPPARKGPSVTFGSRTVVGGEGQVAVEGERDVALVAGSYLDTLVPNASMTAATFGVRRTSDPWLTNIAATGGVNADFGMGSGPIAVLFSEDICSIGFSAAQSASLSKWYANPKMLSVSFLDREGRSIDTEHRFPREMMTRYAFAVSDADNPIAAIIFEFEPPYGFALDTLIAQPCARLTG
jgi:hypothetical protein